MKILFIVQNIIGHGTYFRAFELARALRRLGHEVTLLASSPKFLHKELTTEIDGVEIIAVSNCCPGPSRAGWDLFNLLGRKRMIYSKQFDIVHGFETRPTVIYPALMMKRKGIPLFLDWADWFGKGGSVEERPNPVLRNILRPIETFFETHYRKHPHGTTVICRILENRANALSVDKDRLCLLYNGFNSETNKARPIIEVKRICGFDPDIIHIGYLGSFFQNDAILAAEALNILQTHQKNIKFIHIGNSNYHISPYINDPDVLIETGPVDQENLHTYLSACDIFWLPMKDTPANQGRFPLKFTDYISHGRPIVCTDVGDIPDFVRKYQTGIVTKNMPEHIAFATAELLADPQMRQTMGENAQSLSEDPDHSWLSRANDLLAFYSRTT